MSLVVNTAAPQPHAPAGVRKHGKSDGAGNALIRTAMTQLQLAAWAFHRVLKLARTISDLAGSVSIEQAHLCGGDAVSAAKSELNMLGQPFPLAANRCHSAR
jgi:predicted ATPase with chaperone activity